MDEIINAAMRQLADGYSKSRRTVLEELCAAAEKLGYLRALDDNIYVSLLAAMDKHSL